MLPLALDAALAVLLLLSLGLGLKLHLALRRLRDDNTDFDRLIGAIDGATDRARSVLDDLKRAAGDAGERLGGDLGQAQRVLDDLRFLCERGERRGRRAGWTDRVEPRAAARARECCCSAPSTGAAGRRSGAHAQDLAMSRWPWPRRRPRPMSRRAMVAPALLATIGVLAAAKFALLAQAPCGPCPLPAALETPVVAGKAAAGA